jgi:hypothetical protein
LDGQQFPQILLNADFFILSFFLSGRNLSFLGEIQTTCQHEQGRWRQGLDFKVIK